MPLASVHYALPHGPSLHLDNMVLQCSFCHFISFGVLFSHQVLEVKGVSDAEGGMQGAGEEKSRNGWTGLDKEMAKDHGRSMEQGAGRLRRRQGWLVWSCLLLWVKREERGGIMKS